MSFTDDQRVELAEAFANSTAEAMRESLRLTALTTCARMKEMLTDLQQHAAALDDKTLTLAVRCIKADIDDAGSRLAQLRPETA